MNRLAAVSVFSIVFLLSAAASAEWLIGSPYASPSRVSESGDIIEDWGSVRVDLAGEQAPGDVEHEYALAPGPKLVTTLEDDAIEITKTAYRAPVWPHGTDVLSVTLRNKSDQERALRLRLTPSEGVELGETMGAAQGRVVFAIPPELSPAPRKERSWGCVGGLVAMRGWGKPVVECDPAFQNIQAGMGGVPIVYRFAVPSGARRTVILGLCESHYGDPHSRPLELFVEGAEKVDISPVAAWGMHKPGCLRFDARDLNGDGRLEITSTTPAGAPDRNPILNGIWLFPPETPVDLQEVIHGKMSAEAEYYVDCGGDKDQLLYDRGPVNYELTVGPKAEKILTFLMACPGANNVPNLKTTAWTPQSLEKAASDVWKGWFGNEEPSREALPAELRS